MKINALRKELKRLLEPENGRRRPAIRRSLLEDWIYAADLPEFVSGEELEAVCRKLQEAGWETLSEDGWLQLRKPADEPPEGKASPDREEEPPEKKTVSEGKKKAKAEGKKRKKADSPEKTPE